MTRLYIFRLASWWNWFRDHIVYVSKGTDSFQPTRNYHNFWIIIFVFSTTEFSRPKGLNTCATSGNIVLLVIQRTTSKQGTQNWNQSPSVFHKSTKVFKASSLSKCKTDVYERRGISVRKLKLFDAHFWSLNPPLSNIAIISDMKNFFFCVRLIQQIILYLLGK